MGYTSIDNKRVYGKSFSYGTFGATQISYAAFLKNKDLLEDITYTPAILKEKFGIDFPNISFKISEIHLVPFLDLVSVIKAFGIKYSPSKKPTIQERRALRKSIISKITN